MAAMAHALPVVTTVGHLTDPAFAGSPLLMLRPDDTRGLLAALEAVVTEERSCREERGSATRAFYEACFSWDRLLARLNAELGWSVR
jgi:hypothetical protein